MAIIPAGSKLQWIDSSVPTPERKSTRSNAKTEMYTIEDIAETVGGSEYTEVIVNIPATLLLLNLTSGVTLINNIPANSYLSGYGFIEINGVTTPYTVPDLNDSIAIIQGGAVYDLLSLYMFTEVLSNQDAVIPFKFEGPIVPNGSISNKYGFLVENGVTSLDMLHVNLTEGLAPGTPMTDGDATVTVKIYYKIIEFGS
jgi:hypothetical protein